VISCVALADVKILSQKVEIKWKSLSSLDEHHSEGGRDKYRYAYRHMQEEVDKSQKSN
jgi:hypothetical protein